MSLLLIEHAQVLVTMDDERREIEDGAIRVRDNVIEALGDSKAIRQQLQGQQPERRIDASGCILLPALVKQHNQQAQRLLQRAARQGNGND